MQVRRPSTSSPERQHVDATTETSDSRRSFLKLCASSLIFGSTLSGCHELNIKRWFDDEEAMRLNVQEAIRGEDGHSKLIGDYIKIADSTLGYIKVQGVGLVTRLDGTGEDPPISPLRTRLLDDIRREDIDDPNSLLRSSETSLVVVTAYIPPIARKGDRLDVEINMPDGSETVSLKGGWLMPCRLSEHALLEGQVHQGNEVVYATGPILIDGLFEDSNGSSVASRKGVIPSGAIYSGPDRILTVAIRSDYRRVRMSTHLASRIGQRFHDYDKHGIRRPLATAKSNAHLELVVQDRYRNNYPRFLQCVRHITLTESPVEKHLRMQDLGERIMFGPTSEQAALQLEAEGSEGVAALKRALNSPSPEARFRAAEALAYLGKPECATELREAARNEPAFRIFALAALACLQTGETISALEELMHEESLETRYGAFRSLSTMAPDDPIVQGIPMDGEFRMHLIDSTATPFVHMTRRKKPEVVLFGAEQEFQLPMTIRAGARILVRGNTLENTIDVKRVAAGEEDQTLTVSARIAEVIKAATDLGASYPDIVQMLVEAKNQSNLPGKIAIDEMPKPGRVYHRVPEDFANADNVNGATSSAPATIGSDGLMPNLFNEQSNKTIVTEAPEPSDPKEAGMEPNGIIVE
ncbi:flagellar basal body P-ring protein FlgI [Thalassoglobus sp. JC818]|uniref:flagellar basal body P-ring protein FlgI n=1 Tax=Thalassoglobus sp. JC818 TaxID=3232136 RepID=UPI0034573C12